MIDKASKHHRAGREKALPLTQSEQPPACTSLCYGANQIVFYRFTVPLYTDYFFFFYYCSILSKNSGFGENEKIEEVYKCSIEGH